MSNHEKTTRKHHKAKKSSRLSKHNNKSLKSLHGALRSLLNKTKDVHNQDTNKSPLNIPKRKSKIRSDNNIIYIRSKENALIPKLTDDEVMQRHKLADESMKNVWANIIAKYESIDDSTGDMVDLTTGDIIEDNGHLRGLTESTSTSPYDTKYKSTLLDIIPSTGDSDKSTANPVTTNEITQNQHESTIWDETDSEGLSEEDMTGRDTDDSTSKDENSIDEL